MKYMLCHKDVPVLSFNTSGSHITDIYEILDKAHLPIGLNNLTDNNGLLSGFMSWWRSRAIPDSRQNIKNALELMKINDTGELLFKCYGLSLSDHYWIKPTDKSMSWNDVNFFTNSFSDYIGKALMGKVSPEDDAAIDYMSPDPALDGWLTKMWSLENGERILTKGGSGLTQQEVFNEVLASRIFELLDIPHAEYKVKKSDEKFYSICKDFVTPKSELVSAWYVLNSFPKDKNISTYNHLFDCCKNLGMNNVDDLQEKICKMLFVDYIVANEDRHFSNFGFLRNPDTLEWIGFAPIYDTGTAMFYDTPLSLLKKDIPDHRIKSRPFATNHHDQLKKIPWEKYCVDLRIEKLGGIEKYFDNLLKMNEDFPENRRLLLCEHLVSRIEKAEQLIGTANTFL